MNKRHVISTLLIVCITLLAYTNISARVPDKPCASLSEDEQMRFYEMTGKGVEAAQSDPDSAIAILSKAMEICNDDYYTEYSLARVYQNAGACHLAYLHFERLSERESTIDDREIKKQLKRHFKTVQETCPDAVDLTVECRSAGTKLSITGYANAELDCPVYSKIMPGSYAVLAKKEGYFDYKGSLNVTPGSGEAILNIPELKSQKNVGTLRVLCPKGASKFVLTTQDGISNEYVCPWEGEVESGVYSINLLGQKAEDAVEVQVASQDLTQHRIPSKVTSSCSMSALNHSSSTNALLLLAGALLALTLLRRRRNA
ncbi:MAG: hypothetical protein WC966_10195 [Bradymonadales bacterium]|jgi:MYXO-CTERM domain-containing protein